MKLPRRDAKRHDTVPKRPLSQPLPHLDVLEASPLSLSQAGGFHRAPVTFRPVRLREPEVYCSEAVLVNATCHQSLPMRSTQEGLPNCKAPFSEHCASHFRPRLAMPVSTYALPRHSQPQIAMLHRQSKWCLDVGGRPFPNHMTVFRRFPGFPSNQWQQASYWYSANDELQSKHLWSTFIKRVVFRLVSLF